MSLVLTWQLVWILALWLTPKEEGARCAGEMFAGVLNNISHGKTPPRSLKDFNNITSITLSTITPALVLVLVTWLSSPISKGKLHVVLHICYLERNCQNIIKLLKNYFKLISELEATFHISTEGLLPGKKKILMQKVECKGRREGVSNPIDVVPSLTLSG